MNVVHGILMVTAVVGALWWAFARARFPRALAVLSLVSLGVAAVTLFAKGLHWQLVNSRQCRLCNPALRG